MRIPIPGLKKDVGLGDAIARMTSAAGIKPCGGCKKRQALFNGAIILGGSSDGLNLPHGHTLVDRDGDTILTKRAMDDSFVVWSLVDGEFRNSFAFCSRCPGSATRARAEFERRARGR